MFSSWFLVFVCLCPHVSISDAKLYIFVHMKNLGRGMYSNIANELVISGPTLGTSSLQHCILWHLCIKFAASAFVPPSCSAVTTVVSLFKTLMMSLDTHTCCWDVCVCSVYLWHHMLCLQLIFTCVHTCIVSHYNFPYLNTTWYFHPGLADCRQACIYASILDHWLLSDCSLSVHKCIVKILAQLCYTFPQSFFFPWPP